MFDVDFESLVWACFVGDLEIVNELWEIDSVRNNAAQDNRALKNAILCNNINIVNILLTNQDLLEHIADYNNEVLAYARQYNRPAIVARLLQIPAVRALDIAPRAVIFSSIDTHTASVHDSVSASAIRLYETYKQVTATASMYDLNIYFNSDTHMKEILNSIKSIRPDTTDHLSAANKQHIEFICTTINNGVDYIQRSNYIDPTSNIRLPKLLALLLIGINKLDEVTKINAYIQLCAQLYVLQTEYGNNSSSCPPGWFNGLVYSQQTTLVNEINVVVQNLTNATECLKHKMLAFAKNIATEHACTKREDLEEKILQQATKDVCSNILTEVVIEYCTVFDYALYLNAKQALASNKDIVIKQACEKFGVKEIDKLFETLPIDCEVILSKASTRTVNKFV